MKAEHRETQWRSECRELELKAEMKELQWQADWQAVQRLENSDLLKNATGQQQVSTARSSERGPDSSRSLESSRSQHRLRSRKAEALSNAIAASQENTAMEAVGQPKPSRVDRPFSASQKEGSSTRSMSQLAAPPVPPPAKQRAASELLSTVASDLRGNLLSNPASSLSNRPRSVERVERDGLLAVQSEPSIGSRSKLPRPLSAGSSSSYRSVAERSSKLYDLAHQRSTSSFRSSKTPSKVWTASGPEIMARTYEQVSQIQYMCPKQWR